MLPGSTFSSFSITAFASFGWVRTWSAASCIASAAGTIAAIACRTSESHCSLHLKAQIIPPPIPPTNKSTKRNKGHNCSVSTTATTTADTEPPESS